MASLSTSEETLRQRIIDLFKDKCSSVAGDAVLPLKDIVRETKAEKKTVNRILHNSPRHFTKIQDSPPHWKCTIDLDIITTSPIQVTSPAASNVSTPTSEVKTCDNNDVVVCTDLTGNASPSKKEQLKPRVLAALNDSPTSMKALEIAKKIGYEATGDVNPTLYALREEGKVSKGKDGSWSIEGAMTIPDISPLKLEGKDLYTHEEVTTADGRKEFRMRQVLPGDLTKTGTTTSKDTIDGVQAPQPLNPELLSLLSSVFDDSAQHSQALRIVKLIREAADQTVDDGDILTELNYSTRQDYCHILSALELNDLVKKIEGDITKWKWAV